MKKIYRERIIEFVLFICGIFSIFISVAIVFTLFFESRNFFKHVSLVEFLTSTKWTPLFFTQHFGILPLLSGTFLTTSIAIALVIPLGIIGASFLSEYATEKISAILKPIVELLASVPSIVYGYFALLFVTPLLQTLIPDLMTFNALSAGIVMGVMILPLVLSLSEDAMRAVPATLRHAAYALGSTRLQTTIWVIIPAALPGIAASVILAISRAIGETMIVAIAAGLQPQFTLNPLVPIQTMTAYIVQVSQGDVPYGSIEYQTIFVVGLGLFITIFFFNTASFLLKRKFQKLYE